MNLPPELFLIAMFVLMYFLLIRPQQKRAKDHKNLLKALKKGDEVVTNGGIIGKIRLRGCGAKGSNLLRPTDG